MGLPPQTLQRAINIRSALSLEGIHFTQRLAHQRKSASEIIKQNMQDAFQESGDENQELTSAFRLGSPSVSKQHGFKIPD